MHEEKLDIIFRTNAHTLMQSGVNAGNVTPRKRAIGLV
jgi:hypothetical protein